MTDDEYQGRSHSLTITRYKKNPTDIGLSLRATTLGLLFH